MIARVKVGWKTTEFWVTQALSLGALLAALASALPPKYATLAIAISEGSYAFSRGLTKQGAGIGQSPPLVVTQAHPLAPQALTPPSSPPTA